MYLQRLIELDLIEPSETQVDVLSAFPTDVRKRIVNEILTSLLQHRREAIPLTTYEHIEWVQMVLGHGFGLELDEANLIENCIMVYSQWLLEKHARPIFFNRGTPLSSASHVFAGMRASYRGNDVKEENLPEEEIRKKYEDLFLRNCFLGLSRLFEFEGRGNQPKNTESIIKTLKNEGLDQTQDDEKKKELDLSKENFMASGTLQRFIDLCKHVSALYASVSRTLGPTLSLESWHILLKCTLAISDQILRPKPTSQAFRQYIGRESYALDPTHHQELLADVLGDSVLRTHFEAWLRSGVHDVRLWDSFEICFQNWMNRPNLILHWNVICYGLTRRIMKILYGERAILGTDEIVLNQMGYNLSLYLSDDEVYFLWYRWLYLVEPNHELNIKTFLEAIRGVASLFDVFYKISLLPLDRDDANPSIPSGNTILRLLGRWLFVGEPYINHPDISPIIYTILTRLFSTRPFLSFSKEYRTRFQILLQHGLKEDIQAQSILICSKHLFSDFEIALGSLPHCFNLFKRVIPTLASNFRLTVPLDRLRRGILDIISEVVILPYIYEDHPLPNDVELDHSKLTLPYSMKSLIPEHLEHTFGTLKYYLLQILYQFVASETEGDNFRLSLNLLNQFIFNDLEMKEPLFIGLIEVLTNQIIKVSLSEEIVLACFDTLYNLLLSIDIQFDNINNKKVIQQLVLSLCRYVDYLIEEGNFMLSNRSIIASFNLLKNIFELLSPNILFNISTEGVNSLDHEFLSIIFNTISKGLNVINIDNHNNNNVNNSNKETVSSVFVNKLERINPLNSLLHEISSHDVFNHKGYQITKNLITVSANVTLFSLFKSHQKVTNDLSIALQNLNKNDSKGIQFFSIQPGAIMSIIQLEANDTRSHCAEVIIRSAYGKVQFRVRPIKANETNQAKENPFSPQLTRPIPLELPRVPNQTPKPNRLSTKLKSEDSLTSSSSRLSRIESSIDSTLDDDMLRDVWTALDELVKLQQQVEIQHSSHPHTRVSTYIQGPRIQNYTHSTPLPRQLLSQYGLISIDSKTHVTPLPITQDLIERINKLDDIKTRPEIRVMVALWDYKLDKLGLRDLLLLEKERVDLGFTKFLAGFGKGKTIWSKDGIPSFEYTTNVFELSVSCPYLESTMQAYISKIEDINTSDQIEPQLNLEEELLTLFLYQLQCHQVLILYHTQPAPSPLRSEEAGLWVQKALGIKPGSELKLVVHLFTNGECGAVRVLISKLNHNDNTDVVEISPLQLDTRVQPHALHSLLLATLRWYLPIPVISSTQSQVNITTTRANYSNAADNLPVDLERLKPKVKILNDINELASELSLKQYFSTLIGSET